MRSIGSARPPLFGRIALLYVARMALASVVFAQSPGEVTGVVTDSLGVPLFGAVVEVEGSAAKAHSNEHGEFRVGNLPPGIATVHIRRLGFVAVTQETRITTDRSALPLQIILVAIPATVEPVVVQAGRAAYSGRLAGYYERLHRRSTGTFISRERIDANRNKSLSQLLSSTPGVSATSMSSGGSGVRMRGMRCRPLVWLDGVPMPAGEVDLNAFPVSTLEGIELYLGATNAPSSFTALTGQSSCGTILLWSRGKDTEHREVERRSIDVEELTAARAIFTADVVDEPARLAVKSLDVTYPPDLAASKIPGSAVAEFVVSASGEIERGSMEIVSASHPLFGEAAMHALASAHYTPAVKGGVLVRQLVQQPFSFSVSADSQSASVRR